MSLNRISEVEHGEQNRGTDIDRTIGAVARVVSDDDGNGELAELTDKDRLLRELYILIDGFRPGDAVETAREVVAAGPARLELSVHGSEWLKVPGYNHFHQPDYTGGTNTELLFKLIEAIQTPDAIGRSWLDRLNSELGFYGDERLGAHVLIGRAPSHFLLEMGADAPHRWLGLAVEREFNRHQHPGWYEEYDNDGDDEYNEGYRDITSYDYEEDYTDHPFLHIDPMFRRIMGADHTDPRTGRTYQVHDVMDGWDPVRHHDGITGEADMLVSSYETDGRRLTKNPGGGIQFRVSQDGQYVFGVGFARQSDSKHARLVPYVGILDYKADTQYCVRTRDENYLWSEGQDTINEATQREAQEILDVLAGLQIEGDTTGRTRRRQD
jgi:hypothetical protein